MKNKLKAFTLKEIITILVLSGIWALVTTEINAMFDAQATYFIILLLVTLFASITAFLIRKIGTVTLFYLVASFMTFASTNLGVTDYTRIAVFLITGIIFDTTLFFLKKAERNTELHVVIANIISAGLLPIVSVSLLSIKTSMALLSSLLSLVALSSLIGLFGAVIALLLWHALRLTKFFLRYEFE
jgi:hypothetical protein